uniref:Protein kinase domain-containing protein n=1 Tax=Chromera velia CCMP2878 TaxID=1169474 RepID=A0A0G4FQQ5_9ALVE|eukprot:Cvel_18197.t1-p1 / transcript=Cvel_18197.t1 / gene=Cvel_18197 / organism=Chromera_velia_CCMP2878 / gene_product=hypothetical protein / transcript_product=hypothetical protein / location=Cvel_scaffold1493:30992-31454(-) / protein_length=109 / sequence_SO=supercontig / SO=protein_coding / is_pseudo=false
MRASVFQCQDYRGHGGPLLSPKETIYVLQGVAAALFFLHTACQIVHLDLAPKQVLLFTEGGAQVTSPSQVALCDFGGTMRVGERAHKALPGRNAPGSPGYRCPAFNRGE